MLFSDVQQVPNVCSWMGSPVLDDHELLDLGVIRFFSSKSRWIILEMDWIR